MLRTTPHKYCGRTKIRLVFEMSFQLQSSPNALGQNDTIRQHSRSKSFSTASSPSTRSRGSTTNPTLVAGDRRFDETLSSKLACAAILREMTSGAKTAAEKLYCEKHLLRVQASQALMDLCDREHEEAASALSRGHFTCKSNHVASKRTSGSGHRG